MNDLHLVNAFYSIIFLLVNSVLALEYFPRFPFPARFVVISPCIFHNKVTLASELKYDVTSAIFRPYRDVAILAAELNISFMLIFFIIIYGLICDCITELLSVTCLNVGYTLVNKSLVP